MTLSVAGFRTLYQCNEQLKFIKRSFRNLRVEQEDVTCHMEGAVGPTGGMWSRMV